MLNYNKNMLNANFTYKNFAAVLNKYQYNFNIGDIIAGTIFSIEDRCILVDIGAKIVGHLPIEEIDYIKNEHSYHNIQLNETRELYITMFDSETNQIILSIKKVNLLKSWKRIRQIYAENIILRTQIVKLNKGGCIVKCENLKGFIPKSHMIDLKQSQDLLHNNTMLVTILEFNEIHNYLLLSSKCAYIKQNLNYFRVGKIFEGTIESIHSYGLFVNVEKLQGLLHVSEILKSPEQTLNEIFHKGQTIQVMIIHVDINTGRIAFSQKAK